MLELFIDPIIALIVYIVSTIAFFIAGYVISGKKSDTMLIISCCCMTLSIACLTFTLHNMIGKDSGLGFFVPLGAITWGLVCLNTMLKRHKS
jgi:hypothetical protein